MIRVVGNFFPADEHYGRQEHRIFNSIRRQADALWPEDRTLMINLTWFGPQFKNFVAYDRINQMISAGERYDRIIWTGILDPVTILPAEFARIEQALTAGPVYRVGVAFEGPYSFNTHAMVCTEEFPEYTDQDVAMTEPEYLFLNYNRKPKPHRILLVEQLHSAGLADRGLISLGRPVVHYDVTGGLATDRYYIIEDDADATLGGRFTDRTAWMFGAVPPDFCSLGNLAIWQRHFLNIVGETEFLPWDNLFVTEKTLKPLIGLRPFIVNGHSRIYQWLRDNGFRTFNHYWGTAEFVGRLESATDVTTHDLIVQVVQRLAQLEPAELTAMYRDMLPDLEHNRERFKEFTQEQYRKVANIFQ